MYLEKLVSFGSGLARKIQRARILLKSHSIKQSVLTRQCLNRRVSDKVTLEKEVKAWQNERNAKIVKVNWGFTTADVRIKLTHLYPVIQERLSDGKADA